MCKRTTILNVAHDRLGHLEYWKVLSIIRTNSIWPRLAADVKAYCESYTECQKGNRVGNHGAPMVQCPMISQPFEQVVFHIVGPQKAEPDLFLLLHIWLLGDQKP